MIKNKINGTLLVSKYNSLLFKADGHDEYISFENMANLQCPKFKNMFLAGFMDSPVKIEKGVTLSNFLLAIEPWADYLSIYSDRDIHAYIAACRKLDVVDDDDVFEKVVITSNSVIRKKYNFIFPEEVDFNDYFKNVEKIPTDRFEIENVVSANGYEYNHNYEETPYGYSMSTSFNKLKNVLIEIDYEGFFSYLPSEIAGLGNDEKKFHQIKLHQPDFTFKNVFDALVIYGLFYQRPSGLDAFVEKINSFDMDEIEKEIDGIVEDGSDEGTEKKVLIAEGAFDDVIKSIDRKDLEWEYLLSEDKKTSKVTRIGVIELAEINTQKID